jgi:hypothetical protein
VAVYHLDYANSEQTAKRITVNGDIVAHRIGPGGKKLVPMQPGDDVVIWELDAQENAKEQLVGRVIEQAGGIFLELRPAGKPDAAPTQIRLQAKRRLL